MSASVTNWVNSQPGMTTTTTTTTTTNNDVIYDNGMNWMVSTPAPPRVERFPELHDKFMKHEVARVKQTRPDLSHEQAVNVADANWLCSDTNPVNQCVIS